jgi:hypothetical protein
VSGLPASPPIPASRFLPACSAACGDSRASRRHAVPCAAENGPYTLTSSLQLAANNWTWAGVGHMLYIDQPIGTGLSHSTVRPQHAALAAPRPALLLAPCAALTAGLSGAVAADNAVLACPMFAPIAEAWGPGDQPAGCGADRGFLSAGLPPGWAHGGAQAGPSLPALHA